MRPDLRELSVLSLLESARCELLLSWFWPRVIPQALLESAARGAFGLHPSLLPRWRGADPYFWALRAGDAESGVSLHRLEATYDTGALLAQRSLCIRPEENAWQLARRLDRLSLAMLVDFVRGLHEGKCPEATEQDPALASDAPQPSAEELSIVWDQPSETILRLIRAAAPYPGAQTLLGEHEVEVLDATPAPGPKILEPGQAYAGPEGIVVATRNGALLLKRVRRSDGEIVDPRSLFPSEEKARS